MPLVGLFVRGLEPEVVFMVSAAAATALVLANRRLLVVGAVSSVRASLSCAGRRQSLVVLGVVGGFWLFTAEVIPRWCGWRWSSRRS